MHALVPAARFADVVRVPGLYKVGCGLGVAGRALSVDRGTIAPLAKFWGIHAIVVGPYDGKVVGHIYE